MSRFKVHFDFGLFGFSLDSLFNKGRISRRERRGSNIVLFFAGAELQAHKAAIPKESTQDKKT